MRTPRPPLSCRRQMGGDPHCLGDIGVRRLSSACSSYSGAGAGSCRSSCFIGPSAVPLLFGPTLLSRDVYAYWAYGRVGAVHEANPYEDAPAQWPDDPATRAMGSSWREQPSLYGPGPGCSRRGWRSRRVTPPVSASHALPGLAALSILAIVALAAFLAVNRAFAAAFVGLNPLVALHFGGGGHNDALMIALVLGALALHRRGRDTLGGAAWALSALVKWVSLAFLALVGAR